MNRNSPAPGPFTQELELLLGNIQKHPMPEHLVSITRLLTAPAEFWVGRIDKLEFICEATKGILEDVQMAAIVAQIESQATHRAQG